MALTKVAGDILDPGISIAGVVTATAFDGPFRGGSGSDVTAGVGTFTQLDVNGPGDFTGIVTFSHTQDSTSASTGTIQVAGGIGIAKSVYIGGDLVVEGTTTTIDTTLKAVDRIEVADDSTNVAVAITQTGAGDILNLFDGTSEVLTVLDTGEVGIGTDSPTDILDVYSTSDPSIRSRSGSSSVGALMEICGGSSNDSTLFFSSGTTKKYQIFRDGSQSDDLRIYDTANTLDIMRYRHGGYLHFGVNGQERLRIMSDGKVGIGTDNPTTDLHLSGTDANLQFRVTKEGIGSFNHGVDSQGAFLETLSSDNIPIRFYTGGSERLRIQANGSVGIGTDDADWGLSGAGGLIVGDGGSSQAITIFSGSSNNGDLAFGDATSGTARYSGLIRYDHDDNSFAIRTSSNEKVRITSAGKVGIGTVDPATPLHVWSTNPTIRLTDENQILVVVVLKDFASIQVVESV